MAPRSRIGILGAGPAGLGAALGLVKRGFSPVIIEQASQVGGNAGSFELAGIRVDFGSHRLHPSTDAEILTTLRSLLGPDLLSRPRHGRILLGGRWIHFPLRPLDLALRAHPRFILGVARDLAGRFLPAFGGQDPLHHQNETFASLLRRGLGRTICDEFYFPFARKIWGLEPELISPSQAVKRVSANSVTKLLRRLLPGGTGKGGQQSRGMFFYPRRGFGQISEVIWEAARSAGAQVELNTPVRKVVMGHKGFEVGVEGDGAATGTLTFDQLWSTIPVGTLVRIIDPPAPPEVIQAAKKLRQRAMVLVYLALEEDRFTEFDAHYFPGPDIPITRLSEPKNYSGERDPRNRTVICAEIPCAVSDPIWSLTDPELRDVVMDSLDAAGLPLRSRVLEVAVRRLTSAYPIYDLGYAGELKRVEDWLNTLPGLVSFGRQGLFAHDNTHHALFTAQSAVRCLDDKGLFDRERWNEFREIFAKHVVED